MTPEPDVLYYATGYGASGSGRRLHVDQDCRALARATGVREVDVSHLPRGEICAYCGDGLTVADLTDDGSQEVATDGGRDQEEWYVIDEERGAVIAGPFVEREAAKSEARKHGNIIATRGAIELLELTSDTTVRWENGDVDVVTDGGTDMDTEWMLTCLDCDFEERVVTPGHHHDGPPKAVGRVVTEHKHTTDESHVVRVAGRQADRDSEVNPYLVTDGGVRLPITFEDFTKGRVTCRRCGDTVSRRFVDDGLCTGCRHRPQGEPTSFGGVGGGQHG